MATQAEEVARILECGSLLPLSLPTISPIQEGGGKPPHSRGCRLSWERQASGWHLLAGQTLGAPRLNGAVDSEAEIRATGSLVAAVSLRHDAVLSCVFAPEAVFQDEASPLMINIRREGIAV